jgi:hypothetical protein
MAATMPQSPLKSNIGRFGCTWNSQSFDPAQHRRAIRVPKLKAVKFLLAAADVPSLCLTMYDLVMLDWS